MTPETGMVDQLVHELEQKPFAELSAMPPRTDSTPGKKQSMAIWKDDISAMEVRVVVQLYERRFLGMGLMYARGFRKTAAGTIQALSKDELYEFS